MFVPRVRAAFHGLEFLVEGAQGTVQFFGRGFVEVLHHARHVHGGSLHLAEGFLFVFYLFAQVFGGLGIARVEGCPAGFLQFVETFDDVGDFLFGLFAVETGNDGCCLIDVCHSTGIYAGGDDRVPIMATKIRSLSGSAKDSRSDCRSG